MAIELVSPVSLNKVEYYKSLPVNRFGSQTLFSGHDEFVLSEMDMALIGIHEDRGSYWNQGSAHGPDYIRNELYKLISGKGKLKMVDLGNLEPGNGVLDTYTALGDIVAELLRKKVVPIILGGSHDLTYAQYLGYGGTMDRVNVALVDERIDLEQDEEPTNDQNFLLQLFTHEPNYLFNFSHIGYQSYLTEQAAVETLEKLRFDCYRLGDIRADLEEIEPIVRDADMLSFDISALKQADAPGNKVATPHGFYGEEACAITRYAGLSDRLSSIGFYGYNPSYDRNNQTAQVLAQMIWYFVEGFHNRKGDYPVVHHEAFLKYIVDFEEGSYDLVFWKSKKSDRWWLEIPDIYIESADAVPQQDRLLSCSYKDYLMALKDELPERWLKAYERSHYLLQSDSPGSLQED